jgi:predicted RNA-binding Zn-ribbon protein involved in translation (DUF1610 family)
VRKLIHVDFREAGQLHCDSCGHDLPFKQEFTESLIGTPCPACGADMLTRDDYKKTLRLFAGINFINRWFGWLGSESPKAGDRQVAMKMHGETLTVRDLGTCKGAPFEPA